jgi:signal transduction histidine kinase
VDFRMDLSQPLPRVSGDMELLGQAVVNLLLNAVQFSSEGGSVTVRTRTRDQDVVVEIQDHGPGIPKETLGSLFKPFFTTRHSGTGLGLPITRGIAEGHRGRIEVESAPGEGSTFALVLPIDEGQAKGGEV